MAFDITAAIHGPSAADQPRPERIQLIPLDQIEANDKNFYADLRYPESRREY